MPSKTPPPVFPGGKGSTTPLRTLSQPPSKSNTTRPPLKPSTPNLSKAPPPSTPSKASLAVPGKPMPGSTPNKPPAKPVTSSQNANRPPPATSSKAAPSPAATKMPASTVPTGKTPSSAAPNKASSTQASSPQITIDAKQTPSVDHPAHIATQLATTVHTQNHLDQLHQVILQASQKNAEKIAHAAGNLEQINPAAANALKAAAATHTTGLLSHLPSSTTAALKAATKQAAGALSQISPTAATIFNAAGPLLGTTDPAQAPAPVTSASTTDVSQPVVNAGHDSTFDTISTDASQAPPPASDAAATSTSQLAAAAGLGATLQAGGVTNASGDANLTNSVADATGGTDHHFDSGSEVVHPADGAPAIDGQEGQGGVATDALETEAAEIVLTINSLSEEDRLASIDKGSEEFQIEGTLTQSDDPSGAKADVSIITPTHTIECHMSKLTSVSFFKEIAEAAHAQDPPPAEPIRYQFVVVGGETWSIQPLSNHPTAETRAWESLSDDSKQAIFKELDLFLKISYGKRPAMQNYADLDELYTTLKAFGMDVATMNDIISACLAKAKLELGKDIVEYPAAFLSIAHALGNRKLYLDAFSHVVGRMVFHNMTWDSITTHYPELADMETIATKYSAALKKRIEALIELMGKFIWPSISSTFTTESKREHFAEVRDPSPNMIRPELTMAELINAMKAYRAYMSNELGRNGRGGGYTTLSGRDAQGGHKKLDYFTELPIKEHDDDEHDAGVPFAEFTADFERLT